jgi:gliding motility-associated-like protein
MIRLALFIIPFMLLADIFGQQPDFAIVGQDDQAIETITVISGVSLQLRTNFSQLGLEHATFDDTDSYSNEGPFQIGFDFQFYDEEPSSFQISPTGFIIFEQNPGFPIRFRNEPIPFPSGSNLINSIYGCYMPWDPTDGQFVSIFRDAGNKLVLSWCDVPVEMNPGQPLTTGSFQIVMHNDDIIDVHLINIPSSDLFAGQATVGILSQSKTRYTTPPGMNNEAWPPLTWESWRFIPDNNYIHYTVEKIDDPQPVMIPEYIDWFEVDEFGNEISEIGSELNINVQPTRTTRYRAVLKACWGEVIATAELSVIVEGVFPNAFNPRSDVPANRTFKMPVIPDAVVANYRLQVYNRWGQLVFETNNISTGWNGRMQNTGQECPAGVYNWIILVEDNGNSPVTNSGAVMLLR